MKPCKSCLKYDTQFCIDCEYEAMIEVLKLAKEALLDLGACDDPNCDSPNCNKAIKRINELLGELENELKIKSKISRCYTRMAQ